MVVIERTSGQEVRIGPYTLRVLAVHPERVVVALLDPEKDCGSCGEAGERRRCLGCAAEAVLCRGCAASVRCPRCGGAS